MVGVLKPPVLTVQLPVLRLMITGSSPACKLCHWHGKATYDIEASFENRVRAGVANSDRPLHNAQRHMALTITASYSQV